MLADMHAHYPMHVIADEQPSTVEAMRAIRGRSLGARIRAAILRIALRVGSDRDLESGHRISIDLLRRGNVRLVFSVLYCPEEEFDPLTWDGDPPEDAYFGALERQIGTVEGDLAGRDGVTLVKDRAALDRVLHGTDGGIAFVHCVEGGFHLGESDAAIRRNIAALARHGIVYVTLAHLFYRQVATGANAFPFLPDFLFKRLIEQPDDDGLTGRGELAVRELTEKRVIVDLAHMNHRAMNETLDLLDTLGTDMPVIASHAGYQFGHQEYMLDEPLVRRVHGRDGVIGLIMAQHQLNDGLVKETTTLDQSFDVIKRHIDKIASITGGHDSVAIGTDLDGFIKPTMAGIESSADLAELERRLVREYGDAAAAAMCCGNAARVLRAAWV